MYFKGGEMQLKNIKCLCKFYMVAFHSCAETDNVIDSSWPVEALSKLRQSYYLVSHDVLRDW